jgi:hypothetical protein
LVGPSWMFSDEELFGYCDCLGFVGGAGNIIDLRKPKMSTRPMNDPKAIPTISKVLNPEVVDAVDPEPVELVAADPLSDAVFEPLPVTNA